MTVKTETNCIGRIDCTRTTTRQDSTCKPCVTYYNRLMREQSEAQAEQEDHDAILLGLRAAGIV